MLSITLPITQELIDYLAENSALIVPGATITLDDAGKPKDPTQPPVGPGH